MTRSQLRASFDRVSCQQNLVHAELADHEAGDQGARRYGCYEDENSVKAVHVGLDDSTFFDTVCHDPKTEDVLLRVMSDLGGKAERRQFARHGILEHSARQLPNVSLQTMNDERV